MAFLLIAIHKIGPAYKTTSEFKADIADKLYFPRIHIAIGSGKIICP